MLLFLVKGTPFVSMVSICPLILLVLVFVNLDMSEMVTKSLKISPEIWEKTKIYCTEKEIEISEYIESLVREI